MPTETVLIQMPEVAPKPSLVQRPAAYITISNATKPLSLAIKTDSVTDASIHGKREAGGPLVTTSDEETPPQSPRQSSLSPIDHDHDYGNISSPASCTSDQELVRPPGFLQRAYTVSKPKVKKKKDGIIAAVQDTNEQSTAKEWSLPKPTKQREPVPMRLRALPQSFWQQPNNAHNLSPSHNYSLLPPLVAKDGEEVSDVRPVSPPPPSTAAQQQQPSQPASGDASSEKLVKVNKLPRAGERKVSAVNTDLLFKLFETIDVEHSSSSSSSSSKPAVAATAAAGVTSRHSNAAAPTPMPPKRPPHPPAVQRRHRSRHFDLNGTTTTLSSRKILFGDDPYLVDCVTAKIFPQVNDSSTSSSTASKSSNAHACVQLVHFREGERTVTLPTIQHEQNYSQMLSELVMHI